MMPSGRFYSERQGYRIQRLSDSRSRAVHRCISRVDESVTRTTPPHPVKREYGHTHQQTYTYAAPRSPTSQNNSCFQQHHPLLLRRAVHAVPIALDLYGRVVDIVSPSENGVCLFERRMRLVIQQ